MNISCSTEKCFKRLTEEDWLQASKMHVLGTPSDRDDSASKKGLNLKGDFSKRDLNLKGDFWRGKCCHVFQAF